MEYLYCITIARAIKSWQLDNHEKMYNHTGVKGFSWNVGNYYKLGKT